MIQAAGPNTFNVSGELVFATVPAIAKETETLFVNTKELVIDLSGVTRVDSAALALLVEWLANAEKRQKTLNFKNVPPKLIAIARVSNLEEVLPFA